MTRGGLEYWGENIEDYKRVFEMKTAEDGAAWKALIKLCKTLNQTPPEKLEAALRPMCDIEGLLWFLALDVAVINNDGYWVRSSDYSIYLDDRGIFHFIPHDTNETFTGIQGAPGGGGMAGGRPGGGGFRMFVPTPGELLPAMLRETLKLTDEQKKKLDALQKETDEKLAAILSDEQTKQLKEMKDRPQMPFGGGPGGGGFGGPGGGGGGVKLDPLIGLNNMRMPLRSKVLAVPALKEKYLANVRTIAEKSFDWKTLGPLVAQYRALLEKEIERDTRKLSSLEAFQRLTADNATEARGREMPLRAFADQRRAYLLEVTAKK
jgi:spore coat protein CotH